MNYSSLSMPAFVNKLSGYHFFNRTLTLLPFVVFIILLPHLVSCSVLVIAYILGILIWFALHTLSIRSLPGKLWRFTLLVSALVIIIMDYGFHFSQQAALSLLSILICLKLFEVRNELDRRNIFLILFLGYFILITHFLQSQDLILSLFSFANLIVLTLMLAAFNRKPRTTLSFRDNIQLISRLFTRALPIAIVFFFFFPRIPGPLWSLPSDGKISTTGLSDKMFPGSVTELVNSDEIAFRINFHGSLPAADRLYWRGPVLSETDGFLWTQKKPTPLKKAFADIIKNTSAPIAYTITLQPHHQKWLFALEMPIEVKGDTIQGFSYNNDLQLLNKSNIHQLTQYHVRSVSQFTFDKHSAEELKKALVFPPSSNPKTHQLGLQWRNTLATHQQIVLAGLNYFKSNPFYYTKRPEAMTENPSDEFLFEKRRGFCEHYASSFVLLMRAAGIPSRVVTGYQGMEKNDIGNYYLVRQSNAHAWAEVWLDNKGWIRVDPTAMIPPERIEADIFQTFLERLNFSSLNLPTLDKLSAQQKTAFYQFYKELRQSIDNLKHSWDNWILGYDRTKQNLLLKLIGLSASWQNLIILLIAALMFLVIIFRIVQLFQQHQHTDKVYQHYLSFIKKLNNAGMSVQAYEGPEAIKQRAMKQFPHQKAIIQAIINDYMQIRYGKNHDQQMVNKFTDQIQRYH